MAEFASRALFNLILGSLARQGIAPPSGRAGGKAAHLPLASKRELVEAVLRHHGPRPLLRVGEALEAVAFDPTVAVLLRAASPEDLVRRWRSLERYHHSRHVVEVLESAPGRLRLMHRSRTGEPPRASEDLLIAGLLAALLRMLGCRGLRGAFAGGEHFLPLPDAMDLNADAARWTFLWDGFEARPAPGAGRAGGPGIAARCAALVAGDMTRRWTLADVAGDLGLSARTLQRRLNEDGTTLQDVVGRVRAEAACRMLVGTAHGLGEIGYCCGYSDQAHFSREFRARIGMPPIRYREVGAGAGRALAPA